jgi:hypothetical protein
MIKRICEIVYTLWTHVLDEQAPVALTNESALEFVLAGVVVGAQILVEMIHNVGIVEDDELLADGVLAQVGLDDGLEELLLAEIVKGGSLAG